jgi:uncharacterized protein (DUF2236 family)
MLLGGGRALILQMAHPHVGAAVEQHSRYRDDRWGRLTHTLRAMGESQFGDTETATRSADRMRRLPVHYRGVVPAGAAAGRRYDAADPSLVLWVWATLLDTSLVVYQRFVRRLTPQEIARYYVEQQRMAELCGVPAGQPPPTYAAFRAYFDDVVRDTLEATPAAREATALVMNPFRLPRAAAPIVQLTGLPTAALLPEPLRSELCVNWTPSRARLFQASAAALRTLHPALPAPLHRVRSARAAQARIRGG